MADIDLKSLADDADMPSGGYLVGADSKTASSPSMYTADAVAARMAASTPMVDAIDDAITAALADFTGGLTAADLGYIVPTAMTQAAIEAAMVQAGANSLAGNGPVTVLLNQPGTFTFTTGMLVGHSVTNLTTRIPRVNIEIGPNTILQKSSSWTTGSGDARENALFQFIFVSNIRIYGGGRILGRGAARSPGTINPQGDDGIRIFSALESVHVHDILFKDLGDAALRTVSLASDPNETTGYGMNRVWVDKCQFFNCGQTSTTNSSGQVKGPRNYWMTRCYGNNLNSFKWAVRGGPTTGLIIKDTVVENSTTGLEVDGYSNVHISGVFIDGTSGLNGISIIHNLFIGGSSNVDLANRFPITNFYVQAHLKNLANNGITVSPASQTRNGANTDIYDQESHSITIDVTVENVTNASAVGVDLWGEYRNLRVNAAFKNFQGLLGVRLIPVTRNNPTYPQAAYIKVSGTFLRASGSSGTVCFVDKDSQSTAKAKGITIELDGVFATNLDRMLQLYNTKGLHLRVRNVEGGFVNGFFFSQTNQNEDLYIDEFQARNDAHGLIVANVVGGVVDNVDLTATQNYLVLGTSSAGVRLGKNIRLRNNTTLLPQNVANTQLPGPGTISRSGAVFTVPVSYSAITGYVGTDFTPTSAISGFRVWTAAGVAVPITSAVRTDANTITVTASSDPGANAILAYRDDLMWLDNGWDSQPAANTWRDNSAMALGLRPFRQAVASAAPALIGVPMGLLLALTYAA
jgi:hypothetical protein